MLLARPDGIRLPPHPPTLANHYARRLSTDIVHCQLPPWADLSKPPYPILRVAASAVSPPACGALNREPAHLSHPPGIIAPSSDWTLLGGHVPHIEFPYIPSTRRPVRVLAACGPTLVLCVNTATLSTIARHIHSRVRRCVCK